MVKIIDCPRDAMQGLENFIPTEKKIGYLNQLLKVGFRTLDFGSFVSPKAIPQLKDTAKVVEGLDLDGISTRLLAIIANERGARDASQFDQISYLGYPFSISETFQLKNTNATLEESIIKLETIKKIANKNNKKLIVYIAMGFGNPYNDEWNIPIVHHWVNRLNQMGIGTIIFSDTVGVSHDNEIEDVFSQILPEFSEIEFGAHFHSRPHSWREKIDTAFKNGCRRFDGALQGFGGCPMSGCDLVGNMATENIILYMDEMKQELGLNRIELEKAKKMAIDFFPK